MKKILPLLLMAISAIYTKAQDTSFNPINVSVVGSGKPVNAPGDSIKVTKKSDAARPHRTKTNTATAKPADGAVTTDKLANDILASLNQSNFSQAKKSEPPNRMATEKN